MCECQPAIASHLANTKSTARPKPSPAAHTDLPLPPLVHDKSTVIQEARVFNESPISPRKCRSLLARIVYLLYCGETFSVQEATQLFFGVTKLFQHKDVSTRHSHRIGRVWEGPVGRCETRRSELREGDRPVTSRTAHLHDSCPSD